MEHLFMIGSCFTTEVGRRLEAEGLDICINPTGNAYNPLSVARTIINLLRAKEYRKEDLILNQGLWRSFDHHTRLAAPTPEEALARINNSMKQGREALLSATHVIATFGTAWVWERQGQVVCNCHKLPDREFIRRRLSIPEIVDTWQPIIDQFPDKQFIFTVSPIRHLAQGAHANQLSKATLLLAIDQLKNCSYFPAYEIVFDELRDYRFYKDDRVHPSDEAVDIIFRRFLTEFTCRYKSARK